MGSFITMIQVLGYSVALSGLMLFKMTGGSAVSPAGQQVMRVVHGVAVSLLPGRSRVYMIRRTTLIWAGCAETLHVRAKAERADDCDYSVGHPVAGYWQLLVPLLSIGPPHWQSR